MTLQTAGLAPDETAARIDRIEGESEALCKALGLLWRPARRGGPIVNVIAAGMLALAELHRAKTELREGTPAP